MPYTDSAGVKLNRNADLIIEAEASGTVTSCRDAVTGTEYVGGGSSGDIVLSDLHIINNSNSDIQINGAMCFYNEYDDPQYTSGYIYTVYSNSDEHINVVVYHGLASLIIKALSGATITTSGNIVAGYGNSYDMTGDAEVTAV
jgi:hypothetical protein